ncbi:Permease of the drug/metabolite transporter (DMT) superfamily [Pacificimonas flava]|uniref:Permease of the drug/metabolite transporter (DMT) superfamily n=1 Tax=Pacificimonas flava TaxID=1234595 RepID=M2TKF2_9SPHN|nr:EamA family transporter [Pacificimonas flava]EMD82156.1 Permease of the drug/metabolite transporter (DMT) superfamily [Pacificimonas flava]
MPPPSGLPPLHLFFAVLVMAIWGSNFVVIKLALADLPPLTFAALRFTFAFLPLALVLPRPRVSWRNLAVYGLLIGVGQFGLLFLAMRSDITPGLASLIVQVQVFFTIGLSVLIMKERISALQIGAVLLAAAGLVLIGVSAGGSATPLGLALVILAAMSWAGGNMTARAAGTVSMLPYVVWSSLFPVPVLFALAWLFEGAPVMLQSIAAAGIGTWAAVLWQAIGNTMFGYSVWGWLLARHPAAQVAPLALLVPVFGLGTSTLVLGEPLPLWKLAGGALIVTGLFIGIVFRGRRPRGIAKNAPTA